MIDVTVPPNTVQTTAEYIVVKNAKSPVGESLLTTNRIVSDLAEILHRSQQPNELENPQPPMLPGVTVPTATDIQTIRPHGTNANQDNPEDDVQIPDAANTLPLDATQSGSQTRITDEQQN